MISVKMVRGRYEVHGPPQVHTVLERIGAEPRPKRGTVVLPPCVRLRHLSSLGHVSADRQVLQREQMISELLDLKEQRDIELDGVYEGLDPHQRVGAAFLAKAERAILADAIGVGKTAQAIAAADLVKAKRILVVAKKALLDATWARQIKEFSTDPDAQVYTSRSKAVPDSRWVIVNYDLVVQRQQVLSKIKWDVLICDEATQIKNRRAQRTTAVWSLAKKARYCWLLAARTIRNTPDELWSLLHCLEPEIYSSYWGFRRRVCLEEPVYGPNGQVITRKVVGLKDPELFRFEMEPMMLARPKDVTDLPPITYETVWVKMKPRQERLYRQLQSAKAAILKDGVLAPKTAMELLLRHREIACDPRMHGEDVVGEKTEVAIGLIEGLVEDGHKVLVFTNWRRYLDLLASDLTRVLGKDAVTTYHGGLNDSERRQSLSAFEGKKTNVLIATVQTAGEGLNLQHSDVVVWLDRPWTPVDVEQAEGRAWRRGQTQPVHVYSVLTERTVEEYVERVLDGKLRMQDAVKVVQELWNT